MRDDSTSDDPRAEAIVPDQIRAVGALYATWQLEQLRLFDVVERLVERFMQGQLPIRTEAGGQALEQYHLDRDTLLTRQQRFALYTRVLGAPEADDMNVTANREFDDLLRRFIAAVADFGRQQQMADAVGQRSEEWHSLTSDRVRLAGRQLAFNATAHASSTTQPALRRLIDQTEQALEILKTPEILSAYAVQSPWEVIERVAASELGAATPNIVGHRTMAHDGKAILDLVAANPGWWSADDGPRLDSSPIRDALVRHAERWLKAASALAPQSDPRGA